MIGVILPTRGLVFTRVEEALEKERERHEIRIYRSHDLPIPQGHNYLTEQALKDGCEWLWFVEEDTVPLAGSLEQMLQADGDIVCIDYGVSGWSCISKSIEGEILWCGLGCTLVNRKVLEVLEQPIFRSDKTLRLNDWTWQDLPADYVKNRGYGNLDIWFCWQAREKGFVIKQVEGECDHLELAQIGRKEINDGLHRITLKPKITNHQTFNLKEVKT